ncbi:MAG: DUF2891 domain-containing protein [Acidobacteriota bacterium]
MRHDPQSQPPLRRSRSPLRPVAFAVIALLTAAPQAPASAAVPTPAGTAPDPEVGVDAAARFAGLALACVHQEYPNKIAHVLQEDGDAQTPRQLTPAFYGCYDWHSAVHGHWLLARLARLYPDAPFAADARAALATSLTSANIAIEVAYFEGAGRAGFERPYGLAWLLQLAAELREWGDDLGQELAATLEPLETTAAERLRTWIPKLTHPIRGGEHSQTAFAFGLTLDWARRAGDWPMARLLERRIEELYAADRQCPLAYEPSGHDFLSPCLAEADLMRRVMRRGHFAAWLGSFLPQIPHHRPDDLHPADSPQHEVWLEPATASDRTDGKLAHLDGLNLSRAWMLEGIASGLPTADPRIPALMDAARLHRGSGLESVTGEHYAGGHWLGSFATYLVTQRGGATVLSRGRIDIAYRGASRSDVAEILLPRAERALAAVEKELDVEYGGRLRIDLDPGHRFPSQNGDQLFIPAGPLGKENKYGLSLVHEITHAVAPSAHRPDRFFDDGLAVHLQEKLGEAPSFPHFNDELHAATRKAAAEHGDFLALAEAEQKRWRGTAEESRLAYLQEGSFVRFLIESRGLEAFWRVYRDGAALETVYGQGFDALEAAWRDMLAALD